MPDSLLRCIHNTQIVNNVCMVQWLYVYNAISGADLAFFSPTRGGSRIFHKSRHFTVLLSFFFPPPPLFFSSSLGAQGEGV